MVDEGIKLLASKNNKLDEFGLLLNEIEKKKVFQMIYLTRRLTIYMTSLKMERLEENFGVIVEVLFFFRSTKEAKEIY